VVGYQFQWPWVTSNPVFKLHGVSRPPSTHNTQTINVNRCTTCSSNSISVSCTYSTALALTRTPDPIRPMSVGGTDRGALDLGGRWPGGRLTGSAAGDGGHLTRGTNDRTPYRNDALYKSTSTLLSLTRIPDQDGVGYFRGNISGGDAYLNAPIVLLGKLMSTLNRTAVSARVSICSKSAIWTGAPWSLDYGVDRLAASASARPCQGTLRCISGVASRPASSELRQADQRGCGSD